MSNQNKSCLQRRYREKEINGFSMVQTVIMEATRGEVQPQTRQDVLRQAAKLIRELHTLNTKLQDQLCSSRASSEMPSSSSCIYDEGLEPTIHTEIQNPYFFIGPSNGVCQAVDNMPSPGNSAMGTASVSYDHVIGQWGSNHPYNLNYSIHHWMSMATDSEQSFTTLTEVVASHHELA